MAFNSPKHSKSQPHQYFTSMSLTIIGDLKIAPEAIKISGFTEEWKAFHTFGVCMGLLFSKIELVLIYWLGYKTKLGQYLISQRDEWFNHLLVRDRIKVKVTNFDFQPPNWMEVKNLGTYYAVLFQVLTTPVVSFWRLVS